MIHFFEKPSSLSRVHSFALVFMELFKTFFLIIYWFSLNMSHVGLKKKVTRSDLFKTLLTLYRPNICFKLDKFSQEYLS